MEMQVIVLFLVLLLLPVEDTVLAMVGQAQQEVLAVLAEVAHIQVQEALVIHRQ